MSIKIGVNSLSSKDVIDVKAGVSSSVFKNIDLVKDWNEKIIWQRDKRHELLSSNTSFSYQKTWSDTSSNKYYEPTPYPYYEDDYGYIHKGYIGYFYGTTWTWLQEGEDYTVSWKNNRVPATGEWTSITPITGTGTMCIEGIGKFKGTIEKTFDISYTYEEPEPEVYYYYVAFHGNGNTGGSMSTQTLRRNAYGYLNANQFTHDTLCFNGWSSTSTGSVEYVNQAEVWNLAATNQTKNLYAIWGKCSIASISPAGKGTSATYINPISKEETTVKGFTGITLSSIGGLNVTLSDGNSITVTNANIDSYDMEYTTEFVDVLPLKKEVIVPPKAYNSIAGYTAQLTTKSSSKYTGDATTTIYELTNQ